MKHADMQGGIVGTPPPMTTPNSPKNSEESSTFDLRLIHKKLPKVLTSIRRRSNSVQTPPPVPKNPKRLHQIEEILAPLHLTLLKKESKPSVRKVSPNESEMQQKILRRLIRQNSKLTPMPELHLKLQQLQQGNTKSLFPSPGQILQKTERNFVKSKQINENDREALRIARNERLADIVDSLTKLDESVKLKNRSWMHKPTHGTAKEKLRAHATYRRRLNRLVPSSSSEDLSEESASNASVSTSITSQKDEALSAAMITTETDESSNVASPISSEVMPAKKVETEMDESSSKMPPPPLPQKTSPEKEESQNASECENSEQLNLSNENDTTLRNDSKPNPRKSKVRVLVLKKRVKIRPGSLFKCRRTKEKFTFTTVHRTITESGLALLCAAYAIRSAAVHDQGNDDSSVHAARSKLPPDIRNYSEDTSIQELARLSTRSNCVSEEEKTKQNEDTGNSALTTANCYCQTLGKKGEKGFTSKRKPSTPSVMPSRRTSESNSSMILVNCHTQSLLNSTADLSPEVTSSGGVFGHTIELLNYGKEVERKINALKTEGIVLELGKRPELTPYPHKFLGESPIQTALLEKNSLKDAMDQGVCNALAHSGFSHANLCVIEVLSEILDSFYENFASKLKAAAEKEVVGMSHGFLDPIDRVTTELGLGGVRGLGEYYETRVLAYHRTMERWVEKLENKFATLIAYKVRGSLGSSSTRATSSVSVGSGAGNRNSKTLLGRSGLAFPTKNESGSSNDLRPESGDLQDSLNLQIDSAPSLSSVEKGAL